MPSRRSEALSLAVATLALALAACAPQAATPSPTRGSTPPPTTSPVPTASPSTPANPVLDWLGGILPDAPEGSAVVAVVEGETGLVAIAHLFDSGHHALVWTSPDGRTWTSVSDLGDLADAAVIAAIAMPDGRLLAVGRDPADPGTDLAAAWISNDGSAWRRVDGGPDLRDGQLVDVIVTDDGFLAVGGLPGADAAMIWRSEGGETWQRVPDDPTFRGAFLWAVAEGGPGYVAVGWRRDPEPSAAIWTSSDGTTWALAPELPERVGFQVRDIVRVGETLVAAGDGVEVAGARVWRSADGVTWDVAEPGPGFEDGSIADLAPAGFGLVAVGGRDGAPAGWWSHDGVTWRGLSLADDGARGYLTVALGVPDGLLAMGAVEERVGETGSFISWAAVWLGIATGS